MAFINLIKEKPSSKADLRGKPHGCEPPSMEHFLHSYTRLMVPKCSRPPLKHSEEAKEIHAKCFILHGIFMM